jgi:hypothetical protein
MDGLIPVIQYGSGKVDIQLTSNQDRTNLKRFLACLN